VRTTYPHSAKLEALLAEYRPSAAEVTESQRDAFSVAHAELLAPIREQRLKQLSSDLAIEADRIRELRENETDWAAVEHAAAARREMASGLPDSMRLAPTSSPGAVRVELPSMVVPTILAAAPYSFGHPSPEFKIAAPQPFGDKGYSSYSAAAFPDEGRLSLGALGGTLWVGGGPAPGFPEYRMPRGLFAAEHVSPSASITQITDVSQFATAGPFTLQVRVDVAVPLAAEDRSRAFYCFPAFSANGEVNIVADLYLTVAVLRSPTAVTQITLAEYDAVSAETYGPWTDPSKPRPVVFVTQFLVSNFTPSVELSVMLPVSPDVVFGGGPVGGGPGGPFSEARPPHLGLGDRDGRRIMSDRAGAQSWNVRGKPARQAHQSHFSRRATAVRGAD
jgi:hypothetical protein